MAEHERIQLKPLGVDERKHFGVESTHVGKNFVRASDYALWTRASCNELVRDSVSSDVVKDDSWI